ncbi:hypothetical protein JTE90_022269 [Oedothorax gibbosus]|uniref:Major facilitator superfamily (MFS) profile domain-containing protein n=1 Tax=Oedothorax gibbosus TaxID=931172 RepID=A0AAV6VVX4_9ARAC|nr:hypothetical protein JTE90_022269 [Oedothorax gibbosus]
MAYRKIAGPDQPRSWAIALAGCIINTLLSGITRATGIIYVALVDTYQVSRLQANLPFTLRNIVRSLGGPLAGAIGQRYGPRDVTIVGGVLSSLGIMLCYFAPNILWIIILWGGIHGFGVALANTLFQVIITQYFLKYRATASGLALSGACLGAFAFPVILEYMLANFGLAGTFLLTGGLIMHVLPASIMMVEPPWVRETTVKDSNNPLISKQNDDSYPSQVTYVIPEESKEKPDVIEDETEKQFKCIQCPDSLVHLNSENSIAEVKLHVQISKEIQENSISKGTLKILKDPMFHMISLSFAAFALVIDFSITVIVDYFMDKGLMEETGKYFISIMSIGDLIGRLSFGWVTDKNYLSVATYMFVLQVGLGACQMLLAVLYTFNALMVVVFIQGLISGATLIMFPILVGKYLQSVQSLAIGFNTFLYGVLSFAVAPMIGYFRDTVGSYDGMFYITGGLSVAVGFLWIFEPLLLRLGSKIWKRSK